VMKSRCSRSILLLCALAGVVLALAQPAVPREFYEGRRSLDEQRLTFCLWAGSPTKELDLRVGAELANVLLLEADFFEIDRVLFSEDQFWETLFIHLTDRCDALLGFRLEPITLPEWLTVTRPYFEGLHVLAVTDPSIGSLRDVPTGEFVGSRLYTEADYHLLAHLQTMAAGDRWRRLPFDSTERQVDLLLEGTIAGAIVWEPALHQVLTSRGATEQVRSVSLDPLPEVTTQVAMVLRSDEVLLRRLLDEALYHMQASGALAVVVAEVGIPGRVPR